MEELIVFENILSKLLQKYGIGVDMLDSYGEGIFRSIFIDAAIVEVDELVGAVFAQDVVFVGVVGGFVAGDDFLKDLEDLLSILWIDENIEPVFANYLLFIPADSINCVVKIDDFTLFIENDHQMGYGIHAFSSF